MISIIRRLIHSKFGVVFALAFLALVAAGFILGDLSSGQFGSTSGGGGTAAKVGGTKLRESELQDRVQRVFENARKQNPGLQIDTFLSQGGVRSVYDQLVTAMAIREYAADQGVHISKRLVDAQIAQIPAFQDAAGNFSPDLFRQLLVRERLTEGMIREDIMREILERQMLAPAALGANAPASLVLPYASVLLEQRQGTIAAIPATAFVDDKEPTDAQLSEFYKRNAAQFTIPEQRQIRYAVIDADRFAQASVPTEAEISAYYNKNKLQYAAKEERSIEQLVLPTEAGAKAIADQVRAGKSLAAAAQTAGLAVANVTDQTRAAFAASASQAVADSAFSAKQGELVGPLKGSLGWVILRVTGVKVTPERSLASVRDTISAELRTQKQKALLSDFTGKIEDQISNGSVFDEVVKDNGLKLETTPLMISTGRQVENPPSEPIEDVKALLAPVFAMSADDDAQLIPIVPEKRFAIAAPGEIVAAAPPPLAKVKPLVIAQYRLEEGAKKAKALAESIQAKVSKGMKLNDALAAAGVKLPAPQVINARRADLMQGDQAPPAEVAVLFNMKANAVRTLAISQNRGTFVIQLNGIKHGDAGNDPALLKQMGTELGNVIGQEYAQQLERAMEKSLGAKRYPAAVANVEKSLSTTNSGNAQ